MKEKTLRDLTKCLKREGIEGSDCLNCMTNHVFTEELLKREAIKWIKKSHELDTIDWIMHFFNISDEDLE